MSRQVFYDVPGGETIRYDVVDESSGYRLHTFGFDDVKERVDNFNNIKNVKCRDDDVFLNSYPKTGTNWLWEMLRMMLNNTSDVGPGHKGVGMMEARPTSTLDEMSSPRILNTHIKVKYIPKEAVTRKLKTILICRNPKDVVVSFYNHTKGIKRYEYEGKFENYLQMFMRGEVDYGSYTEYLLEWQEHIRNNPDVPFYVLYYEDLKQNCLKELKRLRDFLNLDVTDVLLHEIADNCSINKMRESKDNVMSEEVKQEISRAMKHDFNIMRKGEVGDWKNWFTVAQSDMFDTWWETQTKGLDMFTFRYE